MLVYLNYFLEIYGFFASSDFFMIFGIAIFCLALLIFAIKAVHYLVRLN